MRQAKGIRGQRGEKLQASRPDTVGDFADVVTDQVPERHRGAFANPFAWRSSRPPLRDCFGKNRRSTNLAKADDFWPCQELRPISHEGASLLELFRFSAHRLRKCRVISDPGKSRRFARTMAIAVARRSPATPLFANQCAQPAISARVGVAAERMTGRYADESLASY